MASMGDANASVHIQREQFHLAWDRSIEPIATIGSGEVVEFDALDASCGQITATSTVEDLANLDFSRVDQVNGPIAVDGAEAGDTLEVELLVFAPGGRFSLGDGHAAQGDGEVCGTAIETPMLARVRLTVRRDLHVTAPEFLTPGPLAVGTNKGPYYATDGIGPDLREAARDATRRMIDYLGREHGIAPIDAYLLCSVACDLKISEVVDAPNWIVTAYCPLSIFG